MPANDERWEARRSALTSYEDPWPEGIPGADPEALERCKTAIQRAAEAGPTTVWVDGAGDPGEATDIMTGATVQFDAWGVEATFRSAERAERACACVNACRGIVDPESAITEARAVVRDLCRGLIERDDVRVVRAYALLDGAGQDAAAKRGAKPRRA